LARARSSFALGALAALLILAGGLSAHGFLGDVGWDVADGLWMLRHGTIPLHNFLSQAMYGAPWSNAEWLYGLYVGWLYQISGQTGVYVGLLLPLALTAWLVALPARRLGPYWELLWPAATAVTLVPVMSPRPQLFSYALFAFALYAVERWRQGDRRLLWPAALTSILWTNVHGSAVLLPLVLFLEIAFAQRTQRRELLWPLLAAIALLMAHPSGLTGTVSNLTHVGSASNVNVIAEWGSPNFHSPWAWPELAAMLLGLSLLLPALFRARRYADAILVIGSTLAMLYAVRFTPYLMVVLAMRGAEYLPARLTLRGVAGEAAAAGRSLLIGAVMVAGLGIAYARLPVFPPRYPQKAFAWLETHHAQNVFNWYSIGSSLEPFGIRPYLDGRDNLWLQRSWWPQYIAVSYGGESVLTYLHRFDPTARYVLWYVNSPVALTLDASRNWRRVITDPNTADPQHSTFGAYAVWERVGN
jgi:hypothetical protein